MASLPLELGTFVYESYRSNVPSPPRATSATDIGAGLESFTRVLVVYPDVPGVIGFDTKILLTDGTHEF